MDKDFKKMYEDLRDENRKLRLDYKKTLAQNEVIKEKYDIKNNSRIKKLSGDLLSCSTRLHYLIDKNENYLKKTDEDIIFLGSIKHMGPAFLWHFHNLGVDTLRVYETFINPKKNDNVGVEYKISKGTYYQEPVNK